MSNDEELFDNNASRLLHRGSHLYGHRDRITPREIAFGLFCFTILLMCRLIACSTRDERQLQQRQGRRRRRRHDNEDEDEGRHSEAYIAHRTKILETTVLVESSLNDLDVTLVTDEERTCPICLDPLLLHTSGIVVESPNVSCTHLFHKQCILEWLLQHDDCPVCRAPFVVVAQGGDTDEGSAITPDNNCLHDVVIRDNRSAARETAPRPRDMEAPRRTREAEAATDVEAAV